MALMGAQLPIAMHAQSAPPPTVVEPQTALDLSEQHRTRRKRKAESQEGNERLSKRLSLLNLEQGGSKLYVPVENPTAPPPSPDPAALTSSSSSQSPSSHLRPDGQDGTGMQLDDRRDDASKYKVYIYNLDDELSSSESEPEPSDGRLVLLPDIQRHLRARRMLPPSAAAVVPSSIPRAVPPNSDGELAGMQLVLYSVPSSISVPEERDGVRKAIIESRARLRQRQSHEREDNGRSGLAPASRLPPYMPMARPPGLAPVPELAAMPNRVSAAAAEPGWQAEQADPDAMDMS